MCENAFEEAAYEFWSKSEKEDDGQKEWFIKKHINCLEPELYYLVFFQSVHEMVFTAVWVRLRVAFRSILYFLKQFLLSSDPRLVLWESDHNFFLWKILYFLLLVSNYTTSLSCRHWFILFMSRWNSARILSRGKLVTILSCLL